VAARRSYGTGSLYVRTDKNGRETWYGHWRTDRAQLKRRIGPKRADGSRDGLTRKQAEAELRRLTRETMPAQPSGEALTIDELGRRYIANLKRYGRKRSTLTAAESILRIWLEPFFGDRDVRRITVDDVHDLMRMMETGARPGQRAKGDRRYGRPVGAKSIRNHIGTLSALLGFGERKGWVARNVAHRVELPAAETSEDIRFLVPEEVLALADNAIDGPYQAIDRALYVTAAMTGLRQGELIALRWARRRLASRPRSCAAELRARRVRNAQEQALDPQRADGRRRRRRARLLPRSRDAAETTTWFRRSVLR
jgi:integrase